MCPRCSSTVLKIKKRAGLERIIAFLTGERKYRCRDCEHVFRAVDRRREQRLDSVDPLGASLAAEGKYSSGK